MSEILTIDDLASWLKMSCSQIYNMCRSRAGARMVNPLPTLKLNGNLRFRKSDIEQWLAKVAQEQCQ
jgi:predicted DNA-binding transcriptional regulator AlpA